jgi:four helix bundle protein
MIGFQRLDVYQRSVEFLCLVIDIVAEIPKGNAERSDQLNRSAESIIRNIAEGAGRWSPADCTKHYKIARGEAMESVGSLDILKLRGLINKAQYERGLVLLEAIISMLTKMV